ncbi:MAG: hypothetical protein LBT06_17335 [Hungatella sp.]|jgi:uncharacterized glyoxalase superfamily protein PhnB|nr:hypothetical protein [Hungatella sp.]
MKEGEVCLLTSDVIRPSNFLQMKRKTNSRSICIAFTVDDVDVEFERLKELGVEIVDIPAIRPWG